MKVFLCRVGLVVCSWSAVGVGVAGAVPGPEWGDAVDGGSAVVGVSGSDGAGVESRQVLGFPVEGNDFGWLATGSPGSLLGDPGDFVSDGVAGVSDGSLRFDLMPPVGAECLAFDFVFMTEEYPEWVGSRFNDVFVAQLGEPDVSLVTGAGGVPEVVAPGNFALDEKGGQLSVNTVFGLSSYPGVKMDGATPMLSAFSPVVAGQPVSLSLTLKDVSDAVFDSAVFVDNLRFFPGECVAGSSRADEFPYGRDPEIELVKAKFECDGDGDVVIEGAGFAHSSELKIWVYSTPTLLGTLESTAEGTFKASVRIPELEAGSHKLVVEDGFGNRAEFGCECLGSSSVKPVAAAGRAARPVVAEADADAGRVAVAASNQRASESFARTGVSVWPQVLVGLLLVVVGLWLRVLGRSKEVER